MSYGLGHAWLLRKADPPASGNKREYERADDGKFGSGPGAAKKPKAKAKKQTPEQRKAATSAKQTQNVNAVGDALDAADMLAGLDSYSAGKGAPDDAIANDMIAAGLASKAGDGTLMVTPEGKAALSAARSGDATAAKQALARGKDRVAADAKHTTDAKTKADTRDKVKADAKAKADARLKAKQEAKPKGGSGKPKAAPKPHDAKPKEAKPDPAAAKTKAIADNRAAVTQAMAERDEGLAPQGAKDLAAFADGGQINDMGLKGLSEMGLLEQDSAGKYRLSSEGKKAASAMNKGDVRATLDAISRAGDKVNSVTKAYIPFEIDATEQIVMGIASSDLPDDQGGVWKGQRYHADIVDAAAMRDALAEYGGAICEMHDEDTDAGDALDIRVGDDGRTHLIAKIRNQSAWSKVISGLYNGFSIGGKCLEAHLVEVGGKLYRRITKLRLDEISLVDKPAHPDAAILITKRGTSMPPEPEDQDVDSLSELADITKAADPQKVVVQIQQLRNDAELAGDLESAERYTQAIGLLLIGAGVADDAEAQEAETDLAEDDDAAATDDLTMAADDTTLTMRAKVAKVGRKISGSRMALLKSALMSYAKALADAGDKDADTMLKALTAPAPTIDPDATAKSLQKLLEPGLQTIAKSLLDLRERVGVIEAQPVAGGPVRNLQAISKQLGTQQRAATVQTAIAADNDYLTYLRRMATIESNPKTRQGYLDDLARLTAGQ